MPRFKSDRYCEEFDHDVIVTVHYTKAVTLGGSGNVPTGIECSGSPNGRCGKCDSCAVLKEAQDDVRSKMV